MIKKSKVFILVIAAVVLTAAVSFFAAMQLSKTDHTLTAAEYDRFLEYKRLDGLGYVLTADQAAQIQEVSDLFGSSYNVKRMIDKYFYKDTSAMDFASGAAKGLAEVLDDPYSYFLTADEYKKLQDSMNSEYVGIGVVVTPADDGYITVVSPYKDSPADKAGIKPLDRVISVDGETLTGDQMNRAVELITGEAGTKVTVTFERDGSQFDVVFTREVIQVDTVYSEIKENNIGYISISQFGSKTGDEFEEQYTALKDDPNIKGLIIDLRYDPGGELTTLLRIADLLLDKQVIITLKNKQGEVEQYDSDSEHKYGKPIVVLVNEGSASASEALTGAIKDSGSGVIVGVKTYGKGVAQSLFPFDDGTALNLTTAEYFTPNGTNVNKTGIEPDVVVEDDPDTAADEQLIKAIEVMKGLIK
jgi:carboxyl-terminal processing protease